MGVVGERVCEGGVGRESARVRDAGAGVDKGPEWGRGSPGTWIAGGCDGWGV